jgi:prepilin-type N-terminal cleavage/methylation domain-containing protein
MRLPRRAARQEGYTLIETLVTLTMLSIVSLGFYSVLFAGARASGNAGDVARVSQEARQGFNRMVRETREGQLFSGLSSDSYNVRIDYDADSLYEDPNEQGDYEDLTFSFVGGAIRLNGQVLIDGVSQIGGTPVFTYTSDDLRYDWNGDGVTTPAELDAAAAHGISGVSSGDIDLYTDVSYKFRVTAGRQATLFTGQAQLRNRR